VNNKTAMVLMLAGVCSLAGPHVTAQTASGQEPAASSKSGQVASDPAGCHRTRWVPDSAPCVRPAAPRDAASHLRHDPDASLVLSSGVVLIFTYAAADDTAGRRPVHER
jgi:hypothetical protein